MSFHFYGLTHKPRTWWNPQKWFMYQCSSRSDINLMDQLNLSTPNLLTTPVSWTSASSPFSLWGGGSPVEATNTTRFGHNMRAKLYSWLSVSRALVLHKRWHTKLSGYPHSRGVSLIFNDHPRKIQLFGRLCQYVPTQSRWPSSFLQNWRPCCLDPAMIYHRPLKRLA